MKDETDCGYGFYVHLAGLAKLGSNLMNVDVDTRGTKERISAPYCGFYLISRYRVIRMFDKKPYRVENLWLEMYGNSIA